VKPQVALYNDLIKNPELLIFFMKILADINKQNSNLPSLSAMLSASLNTEHTRNQAQELGLSIYFEAFADRRYHTDGSLLARGQPGAVHNEIETIVAQYDALKIHGRIFTAEQTRLNINADSVCFHGDNPAAVQALQVLKKRRA
jgi:UPF0271 protein